MKKGILTLFFCFAFAITNVGAAEDSPSFWQRVMNYFGGAFLTHQNVISNIPAQLNSFSDIPYQEYSVKNKETKDLILSPFAQMQAHAKEKGFSVEELFRSLARSNVLNLDLTMDFGEKNAFAIQQAAREYLNVSQESKRKIIEQAIDQTYAGKSSGQIDYLADWIFSEEDKIKHYLGYDVALLKMIDHPMNPKDLIKLIQFQKGGKSGMPGVALANPYPQGEGSIVDNYEDCVGGMMQSGGNPVPGFGVSPGIGKLGITPVCEAGSACGNPAGYGGKLNPVKSEDKEVSCMDINFPPSVGKDSGDNRKSFTYEKYGWKVSVDVKLCVHNCGDKSIEFLADKIHYPNGEKKVKGEIVVTDGDKVVSQEEIDVTPEENQALFDKAKQKAKEIEKTLDKNGEAKAKTDKAPATPKEKNSQYDPDAVMGQNCGKSASAFAQCVGGYDPCGAGIKDDSGDAKTPVDPFSSTKDFSGGSASYHGSQCGGCTGKAKLSTMVLTNPDKSPNMLCNASAEMLIPQKENFYTDPPKELISQPGTFQ